MGRVPTRPYRDLWVVIVDFNILDLTELGVGVLLALVVMYVYRRDALRFAAQLEKLVTEGHKREDRMLVQAEEQTKVLMQLTQAFEKFSDLDELKREIRQIKRGETGPL